MFPTGKSPAMEDSSTGFRLMEGSAIMQYICERHGLDVFYPSAPDAVEKRARVNAYLSAHHTSTRMMTTKAFFPFMRSVMDPSIQLDEAAANSAAMKVAADFERIWLPHEGVDSSRYIASSCHPTIADLLAYTEIAQAQQIGLCDYSGLHRLNMWLQDMAALAHHDDVHRSLMKLAGLRKKMTKGD